MLSKSSGAGFNLLGAEVLNQLAHMRQQLQQERQRVENALTKQKVRSCVSVSVTLSTFCTDGYILNEIYIQVLQATTWFYLQRF